MTLKVLLSEMSQSPKDKYSLIPSREAPRWVKFLKTGSRTVVAGTRGKGNVELVFNGDTISVSRDERVLQAGVVTVTQPCDQT